MCKAATKFPGPVRFANFFGLCTMRIFNPALRATLDGEIIEILWRCVFMLGVTRGYLALRGPYGYKRSD